MDKFQRCCDLRYVVIRASESTDGQGFCSWTWAYCIANDASKGIEVFDMVSTR